MLLKRYLRPKWQHRKEHVRKQAIEALPDSEQKILTEVVRGDESAALRGLALQRVRSLEVLKERRQADADPGNRALAAELYASTLAGSRSFPVDLDTRLQALAEVQDQDLLATVARDGDDPALRLHAIRRLGDERVLAHCAVHDAVAPNRLAAAERVADEALLHEMLRGARKRDKQVVKTARVKLETLKRQTSAIAAHEAFCAEIDGLGLTGHWDQDRARLQHLKSRWEEISGDLGEAQRQTFERVVQAFSDRHRAYLAEQQAMQPIREAKARVLRDLESLLEEPDQAPEGGLAARLDDARDLWERIATLPEDEESPLQARFRELADRVAVLQSHRDRKTGVVRGQSEREEDADRLLAGLRSRLDSGKPLSAAEVLAWDERYTTLCNQEGDGRPEAELPQALEILHQRFEKQRALRARWEEELPRELASLEEAMEQGRIRSALSTYDRLRARLQQYEALGGRAASARGLHKPLRAIGSKLREMRDWRNWGSRQARERLADSMEALVDTKLPAPELARRIHELQEEWKHLDKAGIPSNQEAWTRFSQAGDRAYEPCRAHNEEQARLRQRNLELRQGICDRLEAFLADTDWSHVDWRAAKKFAGEVQQAWRNASPVPRREGRTLTQRFRGPMQELRDRLGRERAANLKIREELIASVRELLEDPDPHAAAEACKRLQRNWKPTVTSRRAQENELWTRFREACDAVFQRRQEQVEAVQEQDHAVIERMETLCQQLEALLDSGFGERAGTLKLRQELVAEWEGVEIPRGHAARALQDRFADAQRSLNRHLRDLERAEADRQLVLLGDRAALCAEVEALNADEGGDRLEELQARWRELPGLRDEADEAAIAERFSAACTRVSQGGAPATALTQRWLSERDRICLALEVLNGVPSPTEFSEARMRYQVERLSAAMASREDGEETRQELLRRWYLCGPAPAEERDRLEARFRHALAGREDKSSADGSSVDLAEN